MLQARKASLQNLLQPVWKDEHRILVPHDIKWLRIKDRSTNVPTDKRSNDPAWTLPRAEHLSLFLRRRGHLDIKSPPELCLQLCLHSWAFGVCGT